MLVNFKFSIFIITRIISILKIHVFSFSCDSTSSLDGKYFEDLLTKYLAEKLDYCKALKASLKDIGTLKALGDKNWTNIVWKILDQRNLNISAFHNELKDILQCGYVFNVLMINRLMQYCIRNYNMKFHQFVLTCILNKLSKNELDQLNQESLEKFAYVRTQQNCLHRLGLCRKRKIDE